VKWHKNGIDPDSSSEHAQYIEKLTSDFYDKMTNMITNGIHENETADTREPLSEEIFQHLSFCQKKCKSFFGRGNFLELVKNRLLNNDNRVVALYGESGCGKTSLMAKVTSSLKTWFEDEDPFVICRFIGTSPESSSIRQLLWNVCQHLCKMSGDTTEIPEVGFRNALICFNQKRSTKRNLRKWMVLNGKQSLYRGIRCTDLR